MLAFISADIPWNTISNLEPRWSYKGLRNNQVWPSPTTHSNICRKEYALTVDAIKRKLPSGNKVSLALDRWTSTNKLVITSVIVYDMDQNWAMRDVHLAFDEIDHLFFSGFESWLRMISHGPPYWSNATHIFEGRASSCSAYWWLFT